jgi:hypothetical protein
MDVQPSDKYEDSVVRNFLEAQDVIQSWCFDVAKLAGGCDLKKGLQMRGIGRSQPCQRTPKASLTIS